MEQERRIEQWVRVQGRLTNEGQVQDVGPALERWVIRCVGLARERRGQDAGEVVCVQGPAQRRDRHGVRRDDGRREGKHGAPVAARDEVDQERGGVELERGSEAEQRSGRGRAPRKEQPQRDGDEERERDVELAEQKVVSQAAPRERGKCQPGREGQPAKPAQHEQERHEHDQVGDRPDSLRGDRLQPAERHEGERRRGREIVESAERFVDPRVLHLALKPGELVDARRRLAASDQAGGDVVVGEVGVDVACSREHGAPHDEREAGGRDDPRLRPPRRFGH